MKTDIRFSILFISPYLPIESGSGGIIRTHQLYKELEHSFEVDFVQSDPSLKSSKKMDSFKKQKNYKGNLFVDTWQSPKLFHRPALNIKIKEILENGRYNYIFVRYYSTAYWLGLLDLENVIIDCDDCLIETNRQAELLLGNNYLKRTAYFLSNKISEYKYLKSVKKCRAILFAKKSKNSVWLNNFHVCPNKISPINRETSEPINKTDGKYNILFIGLLSYFPNYLGLDHFINFVWPAVYQQLDSNVCLRIIGHGLPKQYQHAWSNVPGIDIRGFVDELSDAYKDIDLSIVPIYQGSGTHIKILETLARSIPTVITPLAHRGFEDTLKDNESLLVAENNKNYSEKIIYLLTNNDIRIKQAKTGLEKIKEYHVFTPGSLGLKNIILNGQIFSE